MKKTLFLLLLPGLAAMTFATEIVCEKQGFNGHLQGIAADKTGIYWSFYDTVVKTDYTGKITASATVPPHAGDLCVSEGKIYVSLTYYHKADIQRDGGKGSALQKRTSKLRNNVILSTFCTPPSACKNQIALP